jgi:hypothetical protein
MCTVLGQREACEYAIAAGVAQYLVKPVSPEAVVGTALARVSTSAATSSEPSAPGDRDLAKFCAKLGWREVGKTLVKALSGATGLALREAPTAAVAADARYDARTTLAMVDVRSRIRLELGLFTTLDSARRLVQRVLRTDSPAPDDITEFLSETCNQALGAVKSGMRVSGMNFTLFVPRTRFVQDASGWGAQFPANRTVHVVGEDGFSAMAVLGARPCVQRTLDVAALRENMVLVEDLTDDSGAVLAEGASRLTAHVLVRIKTRAAGRRAAVVDA